MWPASGAWSPFPPNLGPWNLSRPVSSCSDTTRWKEYTSNMEAYEVTSQGFTRVQGSGGSLHDPGYSNPGAPYCINYTNSRTDPVCCTRYSSSRINPLGTKNSLYCVPYLLSQVQVASDRPPHEMGARTDEGNVQQYSCFPPTSGNETQAGSLPRGKKLSRPCKTISARGQKRLLYAEMHQDLT